MRSPSRSYAVFPARRPSWSCEIIAHSPLSIDSAPTPHRGGPAVQTLSYAYHAGLGENDGRASLLLALDSGVSASGAAGGCFRPLVVAVCAHRDHPASLLPRRPRWIVQVRIQPNERRRAELRARGRSTHRCWPTAS